MEFRRLVAERDVERLRAFLSESDPEDYLLEGIEEGVRDGRLWVGVEAERWVSFGRLHDLGHGEGWLSGLRVERSRRGQGFGSRLLDGLLGDGRSLGLSEFRAVIEDGNRASQELFARHGFQPIVEMALRRGKMGNSNTATLRRARAEDRIKGPIGWIPGQLGRVDLLPGSAGGRFGRWDPRVLDRWIQEGKLFLGPGLAVAVQPDWLPEPRTMWVNPLQGTPGTLLPAVASLAKTLGQEEWQAFLPSTEALRREYSDLGLEPHPAWGDRIHLYERSEVPAQDR